MKIGLLEQGGSACFCLIKSVTGEIAELKVFGAVAVGTEIMLRVGDREPIKGHVAWSDGDRARIQLSSVLTLETEYVPQGLDDGPRRRSIPRLLAKAPAVLRTGGRAYSVRVSDISTMGVKIQTGRPVNPGSTAFLCLPGLPLLRVFVRWIDDFELGLAFATPIPIDVLARWYRQVHDRGSPDLHPWS